LSGGSGPLATGAAPEGTLGPRVVGGGLPGSMTTSPPKEGLMVLGVPGGKGSGAGTGMGSQGGSKRSAQDLVQELGIGEAMPGPFIVVQPGGSPGSLESDWSRSLEGRGPKVVEGGGFPGAMSVPPSKGGLAALEAPGGKDEGTGTGSRGSKRSAQELVQGLGLGGTLPALPSYGESLRTGKSKAVGDLIARPDYSANPKPPYPQIARENRYEGTVFLKVWVLENGKVGTLKIERSSGYDVLDKAALEAVKGWTFIPARKNGVPMAAWVVVPIRFQLD
ncbi:MAG: energy transducer TonB, partial [Candidatus Methylomirabilales bacterium]